MGIGFRAEPFAQFAVVGSIGAEGQIIGKVLHEPRGVERRIAPRSIAEEPELERQILLVERVDVRVGPGGKPLRELILKPSLLLDCGGHLFSSPIHPRPPQEPVGPQRRRAEDLGEPPGGDTRNKVELKEPILRHHIPEGDDPVAVALGEDVGHAPRVADYRNGGVEGVEAEGLFEGMLGMPSGAIEPVEGVEEHTQRGEPGERSVHHDQQERRDDAPEPQRAEPLADVERGAHGCTGWVEDRAGSTPS